MSEEWSLGGLSPEIDLALCRWSVLHGINEIKRRDMEMVERVALALTREGFRDAVIPLEMHRRWARIAIAAMREPTMTMVMAGKDIPTQDHEEEMWKAMIDAALSEKAKT